MIITRMDGGLGNQMFQYAYGLYLARKHRSGLVLDTRAYAATPEHGYLLDRFAVTATVAEASQWALLPRRYRQTSLPKFADFLPLGTLRRHKEAPFGFHSRHLKAADDRYLVGYWQSEKFFPGMRAELLQEFALRQPLTEPSRRIAERMLGVPSLAVHVRRGDYVTNSQAAKIYCHLELDYYRQAIDDWASERDGVEVFIFSNDIAWCRNNLSLPWPTTYVDHNSAATAHEDLELMRQAQCCVIANSTFSWWGAWLNRRSEKVVYAPATWFQPQTLDGSSLIPNGWRVVRPQARQLAA